MSSSAQNSGHLDHLSTASNTVQPTVPAETSSRRSQTHRGRTPGVRTVSDALWGHRRAWLYRLTRTPGMNARLCGLLSAPDSFVSHLLGGRRTFTNSITEHIEDVLGLPRGTIDEGSEFAVGSASESSAEMPPAGSASILDANLATVLVNVLNQAIARNQVTNRMAISILIDITSR